MRHFYLKKNTMDKEFVTYEQALALQELGIYIQPPVYCCYQKTPILFILPTAMTTFDIIAPLKSQVLRWFRENYGLYANLFSWLHEEELGTYHEYEIYGNPNGVYGDGKYDTYEEAENACINKLIEIVKK
jgi:hypothetical protein